MRFKAAGTVAALVAEVAGAVPLWAEDWRVMRDPAKREDPLDRLKYVPLDSAGDIYLTLSGKARPKVNDTTIYQRLRTSGPHPEHRIYPYLLRDLEITRPGHAWCADITCLSMRRSFLYLVAVMEWALTKVLAWVVEHDGRGVLRGCPAGSANAPWQARIFNTDQGSQFTSADFTDVLRHAEVRSSMDGRGRWMDNIFIERLWRSLKYECVYLNAFETGSELRAGLGRWVGYYNGQRPHSRLAGRPPDEVYGRGNVPQYPHAPDMTLARTAA